MAKYGDEDDIEGAKRVGLGGRAGEKAAPTKADDAEARAEFAKEEKGKGNRAFQVRRIREIFQKQI